MTLKQSLKLIMAALVSTLVMAAPAQAEVNVSGGVTYFGLEDQDQNHWVANLRANYFFTENFGVEGELTQGFTDFEETTQVALDPAGTQFAPATLNSDFGFGYGVYGMARLPVSDKAKVFARAGYAQGDAEDTFSVSAVNFSDSVGGTVDGPAYGVGATYQLNERWGARIDYTRYDWEANGASLPAYGFAVSATYQF